MKFAAIDIGSNAVRLLIADVFEKGEEISIKKLSLTRVPIRLGASVFESGRITDRKTKKLVQTMKAYRHLMDVYEVKGRRACATSAMREAENAEEVIAKVKKATGIHIELIGGKTEADLIFSTFKSQNLERARTYLYIDVGGGSTEITLLRQGKRITSRSFRIGTVRILKGKVKDGDWRDMCSWVGKLIGEERDVVAIGTGGNINRLFKMSRLGYGELMDVDQLESLHEEIKSHTYRERIKKYRMRPDRADVIVPAGDVFLRVLKSAYIRRIAVPKIGLSDGIALYLYRQHRTTKK